MTSRPLPRQGQGLVAPTKIISLATGAFPLSSTLLDPAGEEGPEPS